ncbi:MAG: hypothetical protein II998_02050 [Clostridia bacterium]|nr:hypothetical protein [Clostridia bacterium]
MKSLKRIISILAAISIVVTFVACSKDSAEKKAKSDSSSSSDKPAKENTSGKTNNPGSAIPVAPGANPSQDGSADAGTSTGGKYSGVETYINDNGNTAAKTEAGVEVELTTENFNALMNEYMTIQGSGSEREKELLDQLQIFFDNMAAPESAE